MRPGALLSQGILQGATERWEPPSGPLRMARSADASEPWESPIGTTVLENFHIGKPTPTRDTTPSTVSWAPVAPFPSLNDQTLVLLSDKNAENFGLVKGGVPQKSAKKRLKKGGIFPRQGFLRIFQNRQKWPKSPFLAFLAVLGQFGQKRQKTLKIIKIVKI